MSCDLTSGRAFPCKDAIGGIKEILLIEQSGVDYGAVSNGAVADITSTTEFLRYEIARNSGVLAQNVESSIENGTIFFNQELTVVLPKLAAADNAELHKVLKNRLSVIARDNNDNFHILGFAGGVEVSGGNFGTGQAKGDVNGYTLTFSGEEVAPAPFGPDLTDATVVSALTGTVTISPQY